MRLTRAEAISHPVAPPGPIDDQLIVGCDPGLHGALCLYDPVRANIIDPIYDMPLYKTGDSSIRRTTIDPQGVLRLVRFFLLMGVKIAVVEQLGRRPHESASAATAAGQGWGLVVMAFLSEGIRVETPAANVWKARMRCPADKWGAIQRADQFWPNNYAEFRGTRQGQKSGRAEAALLARYGAQEYLGIVR